MPCPCTCLPESTPSVPGCVDQLGAECVRYQTGKSAAQALDELQLAALLPRFIQYLTDNPTLKNQLKALLT